MLKILFLFILIVSAISDVNLGWLPFPDVGKIVGMTTEGVTNWEKVKNVNPILEEKMFRENLKALGFDGPIGCYGPLALNGPIGSNLWNKSSWINHFSWIDWESHTKGPLTKEGPLGENGPYTRKNYYHGSLFKMNSFSPHTRAFGVWSVLGPIGPLGAVGALGPLGPLANLFKANKNGEFLDEKGNVETTVSVAYNSSLYRQFDLFENYLPSFAQSNVLDTSFMVQDDLLNYRSKSATFLFTSSQNQFVHLLAVPLFRSGVFRIDLRDQSGKTIISSKSDKFVNFILFSAHKNQTYRVTISSSPFSFSSSFRLFVTGSYDYLDSYNFIADYIQHLPNPNLH